MPLTAFKTRIDCTSAKLWDMLIDKIRHPDKFVPGVVSVEVVQEFGPTSIERKMVVRQGDTEKVVSELITADEATKTVIFKLKDDPIYTGYVANVIFEENGVVELDYTLHWTAKDPANEPPAPNMSEAIKGAVLHTKELAEQA
ncbi:DUF1857 family protein [Parasphingopyxis algicola]|uniref:AtaL-like protein n=1 Tax=Parasphingopyxis algicola TaxID=2026624 RepID=UPI0015A2A1F4|nr:AtaL-like protein [Parasphingopyxis algicola]QLC24869.1 DUF1857 family protein [Parasphingopyxis algicola]